MHIHCMSTHSMVCIILSVCPSFCPSVYPSVHPYDCSHIVKIAKSIAKSSKWNEKNIEKKIALKSRIVVCTNLFNIESRPLRRGMSVCWCVRPLVCLSIGLSVKLSLNGQKQWQQATYAMFTAFIVCLHTCLSVRCLYVGLSYLQLQPTTQVLWEGAISSRNSLKLSTCSALHSINGQPCE